MLFFHLKNQLVHNKSITDLSKATGTCTRTLLFLRTFSFAHAKSFRNILNDDSITYLIVTSQFSFTSDILVLERTNITRLVFLINITRLVCFRPLQHLQITNGQFTQRKKLNISWKKSPKL